MPELPAGTGWCTAGAGAGVGAGAAAGVGSTGSAVAAAGSVVLLSAAWHMPAARREGSSERVLPRAISLLYTGDFSEIVICMVLYSEYLALRALSIANSYLSTFISL